MPIDIEEEQDLKRPRVVEAAGEDQVAVHEVSNKSLRKGFLIVLGIAAGCCILFFGLRYFQWASAHEQTDDAYLQAHVHAVSSRVTGTVQQVLVDDNEHVSQGQVLVVLDPRDYQVRLAQARAAFDVALRQTGTAQASIAATSDSAAAQSVEAQGSIGEATAQLAAARAEFAALQAGVSRAQAELVQASASERRDELDLHRYEDLVAKDQVSRQTAEHASQAYQASAAAESAARQAVSQAQAEVAKAQAGIVSAQAQVQHSQGILQAAKASGREVEVRNAQFATAKAAVTQAAAALEDAALQLSYTKIIAPVAGRIGRKSVEIGQRIQVGQPLLAVVEDEPWIVANFKETQLEKMRARQPVEITIDSFPHHQFRGHIDSVAPGSGNEFALLPPDNATGNFTKIVQRIPVKIVIDSDSGDSYQGLMAPGMSAVVTVNTAGNK